MCQRINNQETSFKPQPWEWGWALGYLLSHKQSNAPHVSCRQGSVWFSPVNQKEAATVKYHRQACSCTEQHSWSSLKGTSSFSLRCVCLNYQKKNQKQPANILKISLGNNTLLTAFLSQWPLPARLLKQKSLLLVYGFWHRGCCGSCGISESPARIPLSGCQCLALVRGQLPSCLLAPVPSHLLPATGVWRSWDLPSQRGVRIPPVLLIPHSCNTKWERSLCSCHRTQRAAQLCLDVALHSAVLQVWHRSCWAAVLCVVLHGLLHFVSAGTIWNHSCLAAVSWDRHWARGCLPSCSLQLLLSKLLNPFQYTLKFVLPSSVHVKILPAAKPLYYMQQVSNGSQGFLCLFQINLCFEKLLGLTS